MDIKNRFGELLKRLREENLLTQVELGARAGLNRSYISMLERGLRKPGLETLIELAEVLNVNVSDVLDEICGKKTIKLRGSFVKSKSTKSSDLINHV